MFIEQHRNQLEAALLHAKEQGKSLIGGEYGEQATIKVIRGRDTRYSDNKAIAVYINHHYHHHHHHSHHHHPPHHHHYSC